MLLSKPTRVALSLASIVAAGIMLGALLLLSSNPAQETYRRVDIQLRYVEDLSIALDQLLEAALSMNVDVNDEFEQVANSFALVNESVQADLGKVYEPLGFLPHLRRTLTVFFNSIGAEGAHFVQTSEVMTLHSQMRLHSERLVGDVATLQVKQQEFVDASSAMTGTSRELVRNLRERGKDTLADDVFRGVQQIVTRIQRAGQKDLQQIAGILTRLSRPSDTLPLGDRQQLQEIVVQATRLQSARADISELLQQMDLAGLQTTVARLRENATSDYVFTLSTVNDARVLLNVFTGFLLGALGYFGFRLQRSYVALNRSHDDLELRVTERTEDLEQALDDLKESQVQLVQAEKMSSLGQLVAGVMHEINTPLLYVLNNTSVTAEIVDELKTYIDATLPIVRASNSAEAQLAMKDLLSLRDTLHADGVEENVAEIATLASDSVEGLNQISELVQSLKDFSRLDRAAEDRFDVRDGLEKTLLITKNLLKYGVEVKKDFQEVPDIFCSPSRLNQVFINLVTNAVQAMDGEGTLSLSTRQVKDWVEIVFEDTGCGIPEENLNKILDPFFTTKPVGQGTGLGLSIVHKIIEEHEGQILVDSKVGLGTRITLGFPIRRSGSVANDAENGAEEAA